MPPAAAFAVAAALAALMSACAAQQSPLPPLLQPGSGLYAPGGDASELCSYSYAPADGSAPLTWRLNRGAGAHSLGLLAPKGFHRVDVGAGEKATSFFFQVRFTRAALRMPVCIACAALRMPPRAVASFARQ